MERYELLYIIPTSFTDDEVGSIEAKVQSLLSKYGATVETTRRLGKFRLAYVIKTQRHGHYCLVTFTAETSAVAKVEEALRITPEVLRHLIIRLEDDAKEQKFNLVQFTEVVVEGTKEDRARRRAQEAKEPVAKADEMKSAVAVLEDNVKDESPVAAPTISSEELERKIDQALNEGSQAS